jgi:hypothetical protein
MIFLSSRISVIWRAVKKNKFARHSTPMSYHFFEKQNHKFLSAEGLDTRLSFYKPNMRRTPENIREFYDEAHLITKAFLQAP